MNWKPIIGLAAVAVVGGMLSTIPQATSQTASIAIYTDAFQNGFTHNPWNGNNNIANTSPVRTGTNSIATVMGSYEGIFIDIANTTPVKNYSTLKFWVNGGSSGISTLAVVGKRNTNVDVGTNYAVPAVTANTWAEVTVPLAGLFGNLTTFDTYTARSLWLVNQSGTAKPAVFLDDVSLGGPSTTTTTTTVGATTTVAATTTAVASTTTSIVNATTTTSPSGPCTRSGPKRIMTLGDSLTYGFLPSPSPKEDSYRPALQRLLTQNGVTGIDWVGTRNEGQYSGWTFDDDHDGWGGYGSVPEATAANIWSLINAYSPVLYTANYGTGKDIVTFADPDIVMMNIGTNDPATTSAAVVNNRLSLLVTAIRQKQPNAIIILSSIPPNNNLAANPFYDMYGQQAAIIASQSNGRVIYADVRARMVAGNPGLGAPPFNYTADLSDGVHMTATGGPKFAAAWYPTLIGALGLPRCAGGATTGVPVVTAAPSISAGNIVGQTLTSSTGAWTNNPTGFAYQWQRCTTPTDCAPISGVTAPTYVLTVADVGKTIRSQVTASNSSGPGTASPSAASPTVVGSPSGSIVVYAEALQSGFVQQMFNFPPNLTNFASAVPVRSGTKAIKVTINTGWQAMALTIPNSTQFAGRTSLDLYISGGATSIPAGSVFVSMRDSSGSLPAGASIFTNPTAVAANTWVKLTVPLGTLTGTDRTGFDTLANRLLWVGRTNVGAVSIDDIQIT
jgi:lysophospholipase L1-like esterase